MKNATTTDMIYCKLKQLIAEKEFREKRKITYKVIQDATGLSSTTIAKLLNFKGVQRIDGSTLDALCEFFGCQVGDLLIYSPNVITSFFGEKRDRSNIVPPDPQNINEIIQGTKSYYQDSPQSDPVDENDTLHK